MQELSKYITLICLTLLLGLFSSFSLLEEANPEHLYVIGNSPTVVSSLSQGELKKILYSEKQTWNDGKPITIAMMHDTHPTYKLIAQDLYQKTPKDVNLVWTLAIMQSDAPIPKKFHNEESLVEFVASTPGSIGFVSKKIEPKNVKKININD